jgi:hypothetical protein
MLTVHSDYLTRESLASYYVDTPDPLLNCPPFGQRLIISWSVPKQLLKEQDPHLLLTLRMKNREQIQKRIPLKRASGTSLYRVLNEEYCRTGGFLTYKIQVFAGGCVHEEWRHQLWAEWIQIELEESEDEIDWVD